MPDQSRLSEGAGPEQRYTSTFGFAPPLTLVAISVVLLAIAAAVVVAVLRKEGLIPTV